MAATERSYRRFCFQSCLVHSQLVRVPRAYRRAKEQVGNHRRRRPRHLEQCDSRHRASRAEVRRDDSSVRGAARKLDRRRFLGCSVGVAAATGVTAEWVWPKHSVSYRRPHSAVAVLNVDEYSERIEALLLDGLRLFRLPVMGRSILLKPNLVEELPGPVNTNSALIGAAARCFLRLGAVRVVIGEGPGHQRDTELVVQAAGLKPHLSERQIEFVDLNRDELRKVKLKANYSGLGEIWLPRAVLESDFVVSNAQSEDPSLGGGHAELEKHV